MGFLAVIHYTGSACWTVLIPTRHPQHNKAASKLIRLECPICCYCMFDQTLFFYRSQTKLGEGNVLRGVCLTTGGVVKVGFHERGCREGGSRGGASGGGCCEGAAVKDPPFWSLFQLAVSISIKRATHILLEWVFFKIIFGHR